MPWWFYRILEFDGLEIHPVRERTDARDGVRSCEQCAPEAADCWSVYGRLREGGVLCFEDFTTEAAARAFADTLLRPGPICNTRAHAGPRAVGFWPNALEQAV